MRAQAAPSLTALRIAPLAAFPNARQSPFCGKREFPRLSSRLSFTLYKQQPWMSMVASPTHPAVLVPRNRTKRSNGRTFLTVASLFFQRGCQSRKNPCGWQFRLLHPCFVPYRDAGCLSPACPAPPQTASGNRASPAQTSVLACPQAMWSPMAQCLHRRPSAG